LTSNSAQSPKNTVYSGYTSQIRYAVGNEPLTQQQTISADTVDSVNAVWQRNKSGFIPTTSSELSSGDRKERPQPKRSLGSLISIISQRNRTTTEQFPRPTKSAMSKSQPTQSTLDRSIEQQTQITVGGLGSLIFEAGIQYAGDREIYERQIQQLDLDPSGIEQQSEVDGQ